MAATRPMLEALLARVQQRAAERRIGRVEVVPVAAAAVAPAPSRFEVPAPSGRVAADTSEEEEIEEYDEELIEVIEDGDVESDEPVESGPPEPSPLELSVSAPSVEMRRRVVAPSPVPDAPEALAAEAVERRPVSANVVHALGSRPDLKRASFVELLDASLDLGR